MSFALRPAAWICVAISLLAATGLLFGQASLAAGRLDGFVADSSGASVGGAQVQATNQGTGAIFSQTTDKSGRFVFLNLDPGTYSVQIQKSGFQKVLQNDVAVRVGTTTTLQPKLAVGTVRETVTVSAAPPLVDNNQSALSTVVDEKRIETLPLNGRNFTDFVLLTPGATTDGDFGMVSFNGVAGNFNNYTVDGVNDNNAFFAQQIGRTSIPFQFSEDVIQEFQVTSTGFEAEFGQAGGGMVNTVTKSGTNQLHGDAYYYVLDSAFNANDSINNSSGIAKPHNRRQQFGGTLGGPIKRDRLFFLGNYEGQVRNEPLTVNDIPALVGLPPNFFAANPGLAGQVQSASGSFSRSFNQNTAFFKLSGMISPRNSFTASYNYQRFRSPHGYFSTPTSTGDGLSLTDGASSQFFQITLQTAVSPTANNELRLHFGNDTHFDLPATVPTGPAVTIQNPDTGFVFGGNRFQLSTSDRRYEVTNNFTKVVGRHTVKAGVDINVNHDRDYFVYGPKGEYRFADLPSVAAGAFELYLQSFGQSTAKFTSPTYSLFAQDQLRATPRLSVNYGLRYDLQRLPQPSVCNPAFPLTCKVPYSKNNFAPRVGLAYSLTGDNRTVLRASFGLFYIQEDLLDVSQALLSNGISRPFLVTTGPGFGNTSPIVTFPNSLTSFPSGAGSTPSLVVFSPTFRSPYIEQGNLAIERQIGHHTAATVGYVYSHGLALLGNSNGVTRQANGNFGLDLNLVPPALQPQFGGSFTSDVVTLPNGRSFVVPDFEAIDGILNPNFGTINAVDNSGKSIYNALLVSLRHTAGQVQAGVAYTFSKDIDQGTGFFDQFNQRAQRGASQLDQRHRLVLTGSWSPLAHLLRGFIFSGVGTFASGRPYTAVFDTPQLNFSIVPGEGFNSFYGPGINDIDLSVARVVKVSERLRVKLAAEGFNVFNHPNFQQNAVDNVQYSTSQIGDSNRWVAVSNPDFGAGLAMAPRYGARNLQFSARIDF